MLITQEYIEQNQQLHASHNAYGANGHKKLAFFMERIKACQPQTILDYGCGKATVEKALQSKYRVYNYDPATGYNDRIPSDVVLCLDVLEHIEPDCLGDVLSDLRVLTQKALFATIATRPAKKTLPDGRNAHLIVQEPIWWLNQLYAHFTVVQFFHDQSHQEIFLEAV